MAKHAPGPWEIYEYPPAMVHNRCPSFGILTVVDHCNIAYIYYPNIGKEEARADANLISAAPDMKEVCDVLIKEGDVQKAIDMAILAIDKAEGK